MIWLIFVVIAHVFNAIVFVTDKYILSKKVRAPVAYAFYSGILSGVVVLLIPFLAPYLPSLSIIILALLSGAAFTIALIFFFYAIEKNPTSRIIPLVGTLVPIFTFLLSYTFLTERLSRNQFIAFYLLILGGILITSERRRHNIFSGKGIFYGVIAAFFFATSFVLSKYIYIQTDFWLGFIWTRIGSAAMALMILFVPKWLKQIQKTPARIETKTGIGYIGTRIISAGAILVLNYAISLSSVTLVNALQGVQYIFLIILALILAKKLPNLFVEEFKSQRVQKIIAVVLITFGLAVLAFK